MKRLYVLPIAIFSIVAFAFSDAAMAAGPVFSNASLNGGYAGQFSGDWWPSGVKEDVSAAEVFQFDGSGNFTGTVIVNLAHANDGSGRFTCGGPISGTYAVNSDGTGRMTGTQTNGFCFNFTYIFDLALSNNGRTFNQTLDSLAFAVFISAISTGSASKQIPY